MRQGRIDNYEALSAEFNAIFARRDREPNGSHASPVSMRLSRPYILSPKLSRMLRSSTWVSSRSVVERGEGAERSVRPPFRFDGAKVREVRAAPLIDEHGEGIRQRLPGDWPAR